MPSANLIALIDDIALLLDDVTVMSKIAAKKTAGVLGDDLALNAEQVAGVEPLREIPVVWAVAKGSALNKVILVPAALGISAVAHFAIMPLLMLGGVFLCYEGFEKIAHRFIGDHRAEDQLEHVKLVQAVANPAVDMVEFERTKIKGAVRTDFILSAEIIVISLGTVAEKPLLEQLLVLVVVSIAMTIGVYGLVAGIVKLDDAGLWFEARKDPGFVGGLQRAFGRGLLRFAPWLMKFLSVAGTVAMFLVGGGIVVHVIGPLHHWLEATSAACELKPGGIVLSTLLEAFIDGGLGIIVGAVAVALVSLVKKIRSAASPRP
jgi:predicted DNA repair protein MutK